MFNKFIKATNMQQTPIKIRINNVKWKDFMSIW
jgi:hypothetical protein